MTIYLDYDGVLADFDKAAEQALGTDNIYKYEFVWGPDKFWERLNENPYFFRELSLRRDARKLWEGVSHLDPIILTALPRENGERVNQQKRAHIAENFQLQGDRVITCPTKDKPNFCKPGDILIDDRAVNRDAWIAKGGIYIIHTDAFKTLIALNALGII